MIKLESCPFCGADLDPDDTDTLHPSGILWRRRESGFREYYTRKDKPDFDGICYDVNCCVHYGGCGASISGDSKEEVIQRWNRRVN